MNKSEVDALQVYLNDTGYVVVYVLEDENYEVNTVDYKWTRIHNWEPDKLTEDLNSKNIVVYKEVRNWRMEL